MVIGRNDHFDHDHNTILSSNGHGQMVKINRYFNKFQNFQQQQKIGNCRDCHDQIWIDHFDRENFGILEMVMVKIGLTILTIKTQLSPNGQKIVVIGPLPPKLLLLKFFQIS
jgi:hypothetical protein